MPRYGITLEQVYRAGVLPPTEQIIMSIKAAGNLEVAAHPEAPDGFAVVVECENKPCDLEVQGIVWEEVLPVDAE